MAKSNVPEEKARERTTVLAFLIGYAGFVAGTILIPLDTTAGGIVFWLGVCAIFWAGWSAGRK